MYVIDVHIYMVEEYQGKRRRKLYHFMKAGTVALPGAYFQACGLQPTPVIHEQRSDMQYNFHS